MFYGDYHTHTLFSDSTCTVDAVCKAAINKNLCEVAITDHGYFNKALSLTPEKFDRQKAKIDEARKKYPDLSILHGIETDLIDIEGTIDINPDQMDKLDILLMGFHRFVKSTNRRDYYDFIFYNGFIGKIKKADKAQIERNTESYLSALTKYPIDIITHLNNHAKVDIRRICDKAAEMGTFIEINMKHLELLDESIEQMLSTDCIFIVNSDAHKKKNVGDFDKVLPLIKKYNVPPERIANYGRKPVFTRLNNYKVTKTNG